MTKPQEGPTKRYLETFAQRLSELLIGKHRNDYEQGRLLEEVFRGGYWHNRNWPGNKVFEASQKGWEAWCLHFCGYRHSKARALRRLYKRLSKLELDERGITFTRAMRVGWTKLGHILRDAEDEDALVHWLDRVDNEGLTEDALRIEVKASVDEAERALAEPGENEEEGAARAAEAHEGRTVDPDTGKPCDPETGEPLELPEGAQPDGTRIDFSIVFLNHEAARIFVKALDVCRDRFGGARGEAAARIATYYLANVPTKTEGGVGAEVDEVAQAVKALYGESVKPNAPAAAALEGFGS